MAGAAWIDQDHVGLSAQGTRVSRTAIIPDVIADAPEGDSDPARGYALIGANDPNPEDQIHPAVMAHFHAASSTSSEAALLPQRCNLPVQLHQALPRPRHAQCKLAQRALLSALKLRDLRRCDVRDV